MKLIKCCMYCTHAVTVQDNECLFRCLKYNFTSEKSPLSFGWGKPCEDFDYNFEGYKHIRF